MYWTTKDRTHDNEEKGFHCCQSLTQYKELKIRKERGCKRAHDAFVQDW